jgi:hypothetical protein
VCLPHHEPDRILEDERQEDADEDDQEGVSDRAEREAYRDRGGDDDDRPHRISSSMRRVPPSSMAEL